MMPCLGGKGQKFLFPYFKSLSIMTNLAPDELGYSEWFVVPSNNDKWIVARTYDTIGVDDSGDICYGASFDVDSEHNTQELATIRWREIVGTMPKAGYIYCK